MVSSAGGLAMFFFKVATTLADLLFVALMSHLSRVLQMYSQPTHLPHCISNRKATGSKLGASKDFSLLESPLKCTFRLLIWPGHVYTQIPVEVKQHWARTVPGRETTWELQVVQVE